MHFIRLLLLASLKLKVKKKIATTETELQALEKKMRKEPQFDIQIQMNKQVKSKRKFLDNLKKKLEELK